MKLYFYGFLLLFKKFVLRQSTGKVIRDFSSKMGVVYIKFAQMLAMQNYGNVFSEKDRLELAHICDSCNPIKFKKIKKIIEKEYGCSLDKKFKRVYEEPLGSASISQVHKAVLKNGDAVAIKVKRKDITKKTLKDVNQLRRFVRRFGRFAKFRNFLGSDEALNLYLDWIQEETDFVNEKNNIYSYQRFANSVNGQVKDTSKIVLPRVYNKLCTKNIIVMEYIKYKTINQLKLNDYNKNRIKKAMNDYVKLSFHALFNGKVVTFHGDPHGGNIYIDSKGNIGFLDMGLIFEFTESEAKFVKELFLYSYHGNVEKLSEILIGNSTYKDLDMEDFHKHVKECVDKFQNIPVTQYFMEMVFVFTKINVKPPVILFKLAKAFVSLYGINTFIENSICTKDLLVNLITEYYVNRSVNDIKGLVTSGMELLPDLVYTTLTEGLVKGITKEACKLQEIHEKVDVALSNWQEILGIISK